MRIQRAVTVKTQSGNEVKAIPIPKPIRFWKGRPVYRIEDTKYLYLDYPWLLELKSTAAHGKVTL